MLRLFRLLLLCIAPALGLYAIAATQVFGQAALLPNAKQTFVDGTGKPLAGGKVYMYVPGSTNKKTTWSDNTQTSNNTNPVVLDAAGRAVIFGQGAYRQVVQNSSGAQQWDAYTSAYGSSSPSGATGTDTAPVGAVMAWASFVLPTNWQWANGQTLVRADYPDLLTALTITSTTTSCTSGSPTLSGWTSTDQMRIGAPVEATCIPSGTVITGIVSASQITVSNNAVATATVTATVFPWGNGNGTSTFTLPDLRGQAPIGPAAMGGSSLRGIMTSTTTISTTSGSAAATVASATGLTIGDVVSSANVPSGTTLIAINGTSITLSANASATASGTAATFYAFTSVNAPAQSGGNRGKTLVASSLPPYTPAGTISTLVLNFNAGYNGIPFSANTSLSGGSSFFQVNSTGGITGTAGFGTQTFTGTAQGGTSAPYSTIQPVVTINYIIKVKNNTTGAGGVVSWGGLIGDIATDDTLRGYTSGLVNYAGLATAPDATMLANISGSASNSPHPATWTQWLDYNCGSSTQGSVIYRGASGWSCLGPGTNNFVFTTRGAGQNPTWAAAGSGTITGPVTSTDKALPRWNGTNGIVLQNSLITVDDSGNLVTPGSMTLGSAFYKGSGSGTVTVTPQAAAGTPTLTWPTTTGTLASSASLPIVLNATTGVLTCPTCVTTSGGAISGTAPVAVSGAGVISITGAAGQVLAGASPAFTAAPTLGVAGTTLGSLAFANLTSGSVTLQPTTGALGSAVITMPAATGTMTVLGNTTTGSGSTLVLATSPVLVTPTLGVATATSVNKVALTAPATGSTLTIADGKTLTASNTLTFTGTDGSSVAFGTGGTVSYLVASGTAALGTSAISASTCATVVTVAATGTATTDVVDAAFNGDPTAVTGYTPGAMLSIVSYPTANNVNFKVCNNTGSSITPGAITLNWKVRR